jgi:hypothetical protein
MPAIQFCCVIGALETIATLRWRTPYVCRFNEFMLATRMPRLACGEIYPEIDPAIGKNRRGTVGLDPKDKRSIKTTMLISGEQFGRFGIPFGSDVPLANKALRLHLENVRKISSDNDFKIEASPLHSVVMKIKVFMYALTDGAAEHHSHSRLFNFSEFRYNFRIDEVGAKGEVGYRARVLQNPALAVGKKLIAAHKPRVSGIDALIGLRADRSV